MMNQLVLNQEKINYFLIYIFTKFEYIIFENMMESSLRGSNILRFFNANEALFSNQDKNLIKNI